MSRGSPCFLDMVHTDLVTNNYGKLARVPRLHEGRASVRGPERSTRPVVGVSQRRVGVAQKSLERGLRRLQNDQVFDSSTDSKFFTGAFHLRGAFFIAGAGEGETMRPAAYRDPIPVFLRRENVYLGDLGIVGEEMLDQVHREILDRSDRELLGQDVESVFHRVGGEDLAIIAWVM